MIAVHYLLHLQLLLSLLGKPDFSVATVDGYTLDAREVRLEMANQRTQVYAYFAEKFNLGENPLDWEKDYQGEIPKIVLRNRALKQAIAIKVQQIEMSKQGISMEINYEQFLKKYNDMALARRTAIKTGSVVYGLPIYSEANYFNYNFTNQLNALKVLLIQKNVIETDTYSQWLKEKIVNAKVAVDVENLNKLNK